ncbi:MAG: hypothetical protein AAGI48_03840 [Verrucomicrobiota bacterium]
MSDKKNDSKSGGSSSAAPPAKDGDKKDPVTPPATDGDKKDPITPPATDGDKKDPITPPATDGDKKDPVTPPAEDSGPSTLQEFTSLKIDEEAAKQIADMKPAKAPKGISEADIKAKVKAGLSRKQAIEVLEAQAAHDAKLKASTKGKG